MVRWGYYTRFALPLKEVIRIQRIRCNSCGRTTNVLPSFLLAYRSYTVKTLKDLVALFIAHPHAWSKSPEIIVDMSTAYRWLRTLKQQASEALPAIRKALLDLAPEHPVMAPSDTQPEPATSSRVILEHLLTLTERLFKAAVRLAENNDPHTDDLYCFLNHFLAHQTGKALLVR